VAELDDVENPTSITSRAPRKKVQGTQPDQELHHGTIHQHRVQHTADKHRQGETHDIQQSKHTLRTCHPGDQCENAEGGDFHDPARNLEHDFRGGIDQIGHRLCPLANDQSGNTQQDGKEDHCKHIAFRKRCDRIARNDIHHLL